MISCGPFSIYSYGTVEDRIIIRNISCIDQESNVSTRVDTERTDIVSQKQKEKYPGTARSAPCPCGSGKKYKRCCGVG